MTDIVERLQQQAMTRMFRSEELSDGTMIWFPIMREAADTIEALRAENADLRENLMAEAKDSVAFIRKQSDMIAQLQRAALALTEQNERMREALKPFADKAEYFDNYIGSEAIGILVTVEWLRAARAAMGETE